MDTNIRKPIAVIGMLCVAVSLGVTQTALSKKAVADRAVLIKGAVFEMGIAESDVSGLQQKFNIDRAELFKEATPQHRVRLSAFYIDKTEVTNAAFKKFLDRNPEWQKGKMPAKYHNGKYLQDWNGNDFPTDAANFPVTFVNWQSAAAYCRDIGKRLPTEAEWEFAARGGQNEKLFPWGDEMPDKSRLNFGESGYEKAVAVASYKPNGYGLYDMAGNVWEFLADEWQRYASASGVKTDPVAGGDLFVRGKTFMGVQTRRVIRGGSYGAGPVNLLITYRDSHMPNNAGDHVGFRCASTVKGK